MRALPSPTTSSGSPLLRRTIVVALLSWAGSCSSPQSGGPAPVPTPAASGPSPRAPFTTGAAPSGEAASGADARPAEAREEGSPVQRILDPATLRALETAGLGFLTLLEKIDAATQVPPGTSWDRLKGAFAQDVEDVKKSDPRAGVGVARFAHRLFDLRWLDDPDVRFELTGVVLRLDRVAFQEDGCGEVRLIYRLRYEKQLGEELLASRLPATAGIEFFVPRDEGDPSCERAVRRWMPREDELRGQRHWVSDAGPLSATRLRFGENDLRLVTN